MISSQKAKQRTEDRDARYEVVMKNLIKRYIMNKSRDKIDEGVTGKWANHSIRYKTEVNRVVCENNLTLIFYPN